MNDTLPMTGLPVSETLSEAPVMPPINMAQRRKMPSGIASNVKQHIYLARDRSSSMAGDKMAELNMATQALSAELAIPDNKDGFLVSVIDFNGGSDWVAQDISAVGAQVPDASASGGTNFDSPLIKIGDALEAAQNAPNPHGWSYLRPFVLFLSDGQAGVSDANIERVQELATVMAIAYGDDADQATLARIASDGQVHSIGTDGASLRAFFAQVGQTLSQGLSMT